MEAALRRREAPFHWRGQASPGHAHEGTPGLQVPAEEEAEDAEEGGVSVLDTLS